jgi:hypothetical protein
MKIPRNFNGLIYIAGYGAQKINAIGPHRQLRLPILQAAWALLGR